MVTVRLACICNYCKCVPLSFPLSPSLSLPLLPSLSLSLHLPQEMMYAWNGFQLLYKNQSLLESAMRVVWDELMTVEETQGY